MIQVANNQKVCIDYLKQYNDSAYQELWKYSEQCQYTQVDHQLGEHLQTKIDELQSEVNKITQTFIDQITIMQAYQIV